MSEALRSPGFWMLAAFGLIGGFVIFIALAGQLSSASTSIGGGFGGGWRVWIIQLFVVVGAVLLILFLALRNR